MSNNIDPNKTQGALEKSVMTAGNKLEKVDSQIKDLLNAIQQKQNEENVIKDQQEVTQETNDRINNQLEKTADSYAAMPIDIEVLLNGEGDSGYTPQNPSNKKPLASVKTRKLIGIGVGFIALTLIGLMGTQLWNPSVNIKITPVANQVFSQNLPSRKTVSPYECHIGFAGTFTNADITNYGPMIIHWVSVPQAIMYSIEITPPQGWIVSEKGTSRTIYMENFPEGGEHQITLKALDQNGKTICTSVLIFHKTTYVPPSLDQLGGDQPASQSQPTPWIGQGDLP